ncbi:MAG: ABC transporter permease [Ornithinimicrobium sp.]
MPFAFLSTAFVPRDAMTGWMAEIVQYNPVTYLLEALRALLMVGWDFGVLAPGIGAVGAVFVVTLTLSALALRGRVSRA